MAVERTHDEFGGKRRGVAAETFADDAFFFGLLDGLAPEGVGDEVGDGAAQDALRAGFKKAGEAVVARAEMVPVVDEAERARYAGQKRIGRAGVLRGDFGGG